MREVLRLFRISRVMLVDTALLAQMHLLVKALAKKAISARQVARTLHR